MEKWEVLQKKQYTRQEVSNNLSKLHSSWVKWDGSLFFILSVGMLWMDVLVLCYWGWAAGRCTSMAQHCPRLGFKANTLASLHAMLWLFFIACPAKFNTCSSPLTRACKCSVFHIWKVRPVWSTYVLLQSLQGIRTPHLSPHLCACTCMYTCTPTHV